MNAKKLGNFVVPMVMMTIAVVAGITVKNMIEKYRAKKSAPPGAETVKK